MYVPDEIRKCVAFIGYKDAAGKERVAGTAFFVSRKTAGVGYTYAITARHILDEIRSLKRNNDKVFMRLSLKDGKARWVGMNINKWKYHPDASAYVDVAVCRFTIEDDFDHEALSFQSIDLDSWPALDGIPASKYYGLGDEVCVPGLFTSHYGKERNIPVIRIGNIAAMPEEPVETEYGLMEAYLIEARSIGGVSGSPVFVRLPDWVTLNDKTSTVRRRPYSMYVFMGLVHGHYDEKGHIRDAVNMGIAVVVPRTNILEVLNQPMFADQEKRA